MERRAAPRNSGGRSLLIEVRAFAGTVVSGHPITAVPSLHPGYSLYG